eukprot:11688141-Alexandrium_andersonii.AAC.1
MGPEAWAGVVAGASGAVGGVRGARHALHSRSFSEWWGRPHCVHVHTEGLTSPTTRSLAKSLGLGSGASFFFFPRGLRLRADRAGGSAAACT